MLTHHAPAAIHQQAVLRRQYQFRAALGRFSDHPLEDSQIAGKIIATVDLDAGDAKRRGHGKTHGQMMRFGTSHGLRQATIEFWSGQEDFNLQSPAPREDLNLRPPAPHGVYFIISTYLSTTNCTTLAAHRA